MTTRDIILNLLRSGPKTSWELCQGAKTSRYGGRIFELRKMGYGIQINTRITTIGEMVVVQKIYRLVYEPPILKPLARKAKRATRRAGDFIENKPEQGKLL